MLRKWDSLPDFMRNDEVRPYYEILKKSRQAYSLREYLI